MRLRAAAPQRVRLTPDGSVLRNFAPGEAIITEYSYKHSPRGFMQMLAACGFARQRMWSDAAQSYGVFLAMP